MYKVGDIYNYQNTPITILDVTDSQIRYAGKGIEGIVSIGAFKRGFKPIVPETTEIITDEIGDDTKKMILLPQYLDKFHYEGQIVTVGGFRNDEIILHSDKFSNKYVKYKNFVKDAIDIEPKVKIIPKKTLKVSSVGNGTGEYSDTSLLKLTKTGSTKLYTIIGGIALIAILYEFKILKKIIK